MTAPSYSRKLAQQIDAALTAAEKQQGEGFMPYPFLVGWLMGDLDEEQQATFNERLGRLAGPDPAETPKCPDCGAVIDPHWCWCGDAISRHMGDCGHSPVPMGCVCHFDRTGVRESGRGG